MDTIDPFSVYEMPSKVLVVEDMPSFSEFLVQTIVKETGFECEVAGTLEKAKAIMDQRGFEFFCAVLDLHLPDSEKDEVVDWALEYKKVAPIVFTADLNESIRELNLKKPIADYVVKAGQYSVQYVARRVQRLYNNARLPVLVLSDSVEVGAMLTRNLQTQCFKPDIALNVDMACEWLDEHEDVAMVLLDVFDDLDSGLATLRKLRARVVNRDVIITGIVDRECDSKPAYVMKSGANDFLCKPFSLEEFTCRVNQDAEMLDRMKQLQSLNEHKNRVMRMVAHDVRGPLGGIQSASSMMMGKGMQDSKRDRLLGLIEENSATMLALLEDLLDFSAIESGEITCEPERMDLVPILIRLLDVHRMAAEKKQITIESLLVESAIGEYDDKRIRQVFDNLMSNAVKYSPLGSTVRITLEDNDHWWTIRVRDEGPGIKEEDVPRLFGTFARLGNETTAGESSTGLGLAIAKNIVHAHYGIIGYEPAHGGGSVFYVQLPKNMAAAQCA